MFPIPLLLNLRPGIPSEPPTAPVWTKEPTPSAPVWTAAQTPSAATWTKGS